MNPQLLTTCYKTHTCRNCGNLGHLYKDCTHPIMSFGIICFKSNGDYLMIQRKDSLCFMEFIRGKYEVYNVKYLKELLSNMTCEERQVLLKMTFDELWSRVLFQNFIPRHTHDFIDAKKKFQTVLNGFHLAGSGKTTLIKLSNLIKDSYSEYTEPEWGFPKGRRRLRESDIDCAIREFCEETGFTKSDLHMFNCGPLEEIFYGTNHVLYRHVYYIAFLKNNENKKITVDPANIHQAREVRQVCWFDFEKSLSLIRKHNKERKQLFHYADNLVKTVFLQQSRELSNIKFNFEINVNNMNVNVQVSDVDIFNIKIYDKTSFITNVNKYRTTNSLSPFAQPFYPGIKYESNFLSEL